jgi:FdhD protein
MRNRSQIPQESLVRIFMNGEFLSALLCTPRDVRELAVGWLFNEGYVQSIEDIGSLGACEDMRDVHVQVPNPRPVERDRDQMIRTSACMGGEISLKQFTRDTERLNGGPIVSLELLKTLTKRTLALASSYKETGGIHCAMPLTRSPGGCFSPSSHRRRWFFSPVAESPPRWRSRRLTAGYRWSLP